MKETFRAAADYYLLPDASISGISVPASLQEAADKYGLPPSFADFHNPVRIHLFFAWLAEYGSDTITTEPRRRRSIQRAARTMERKLAKKIFSDPVIGSFVVKHFLWSCGFYASWDEVSEA